MGNEDAHPCRELPLRFGSTTVVHRDDGPNSIGLEHSSDDVSFDLRTDSSHFGHSGHAVKSGTSEVLVAIDGASVRSKLNRSGRRAQAVGSGRSGLSKDFVVRADEDHVAAGRPGNPRAHRPGTYSVHPRWLAATEDDEFSHLTLVKEGLGRTAHP